MDTFYFLFGLLIVVGTLWGLNEIGKTLPDPDGKENDNNHGGRLDFVRQIKKGKAFYGQTLVAPNGLEVAYVKNKQVVLGEQYPSGVYGVYVDYKGIKVEHFPIVGGRKRVVQAADVPQEIQDFALDFRMKLMSPDMP